MRRLIIFLALFPLIVNTHQAQNSTTREARDLARAAVIEQVTKAWEMSDSKEELRLVVLNCDDLGRVFKSEMRRVFPDGVEHLPGELLPRAIYSTTRADVRRVQYIGKARRAGFTFALFRHLTDE